MEDEDLVMLLCSVILMNQNTRNKCKPRRLYTYTWKKRKKEFIEIFFKK